MSFFSAECIILLLYTWKYEIYFIKVIRTQVWRKSFVCGQNFQHEEADGRERRRENVSMLSLYSEPAAA